MSFVGEILSLLVAGLMLYRRPDLRQALIWGGILAVPVLAVIPRSVDTSLIWPDLILSAATLFSFGVIASGIYEVFLRAHFSPAVKTHRQALLWLLSGIIVYFLLRYVFAQAIIASLVIALAWDLMLLLVLRADLIWDAAFSGFAMAAFYVVAFFLLPQLLDTVPTSLWLNQDLSGVVIAGSPAELIISVALFGALWGPLYGAVKGLAVER